MNKKSGNLNDLVSMAQLGSIVLNPKNVAALLGTLVETYEKVHKISEEEKTKRQKIDAYAHIEISRINAQKEIILDYMSRSFDERKEVFKKQFEIVDAALASGDTQMLSQGLDSIKSTLEHSPLKELASIASVSQGLQDKNTVWDI